MAKRTYVGRDDVIVETGFFRSLEIEKKKIKKEETISKNNISTGNCGEYFVAAELERRGYSVAVPMSNTELFDILAFDRESHKQWAIQVKTTTSKNNTWVLSKKSETIEDKNIVYIFVKLNDLEMPQYYVVPSAVVAKSVRDSHKNWLATVGKNGKPHNDNSIRKFSDLEDKYLANWKLLKG